MGFKFNKGKSWKNLGKKVGNDTAKGTQKTFSEDSMNKAGGDLDDFAKDAFEKDNMKELDKAYSDTRKGLKNDARKTAKSVGKGSSRMVNDVMDKQWILIAGGALVIGIIVVGGANGK